MAIVGRVRHKTLDLKIAIQILSDGKVVFDQQHPGLEHSHGMTSAQRLGSVAHQGTNTLPGFIRPWGSSTCLMRCISASSIGSLSFGRDRKSVVSGKCLSVSVVLGSVRLYKKTIKST